MIQRFKPPPKENDQQPPQDQHPDVMSPEELAEEMLAYQKHNFRRRGGPEPTGH